MPLSKHPDECGFLTCPNSTNYYKIIWIPYSETIMVSSQRKSKGLEAKLYLCPDHYLCPQGQYTFMDPLVRVAGDDLNF